MASSTNTKLIASGKRDGEDERVSSEEGSDQSRLMFFIGGQQFALLGAVGLASGLYGERDGGMA